MAIKKIGVVGTGQMGAGICHVAAAAGCSVLMADVSRQAAEKGRASIEKRLRRSVEKGKIDQAAADAALANLHVVSTLEDLGDAEMVIEAASEKLNIKLDILKKLDEVSRKEAILASNTSSISITLLAAATKRPEKVIGMHFMNPVPVMELVEIVRGLQTGDETFKAVKELAESWGKTTTVAGDYPGFIVNRLVIPFINEACYTLMEGVAGRDDIDSSIRLGLNHPMGPLQLADLIGLDTVLAITKVLHEGLGDPKYRPCPLLVKYVEAGWLGQKTGRGFYQYEQGGASPQPNQAPSHAKSVAQ